MAQVTKQAMTKYLKYVYWSQRLHEKGLLSDKDYYKMLTLIRTKCGVK